MARVLGIDIGGTGIKAAPVSLASGRLLADRHRIPTPDPAKPHAIVEVISKMVAHFDWKGPIGCGFPASIKGGVVQTISNMDDSWVGANAQNLFETKTGLKFALVNDADAAGMAEMEFGAGQNHKGVVLVLTFGTGIGSALFSAGKLVPNTELGCLKVRTREAGRWASMRVREQKNLPWKRWAERVNKYLAELEPLILPDLIILAGGASQHHEKFMPLLHSRCPLLPAHKLNEAGIIGAALAARRLR